MWCKCVVNIFPSPHSGNYVRGKNEEKRCSNFFFLFICTPCYLRRMNKTKQTGILFFVYHKVREKYKEKTHTFSCFSGVLTAIYVEVMYKKAEALCLSIHHP